MKLFTLENLAVVGQIFVLGVMIQKTLQLNECQKKMKAQQERYNSLGVRV